MIPPEGFDVSGKPYPDRRLGRRRADDDDALTASVLLGYEKWAGVFWRHRAKVLAACTLLASGCSYVVGHLGHIDDMEEFRGRMGLVERRVTAIETGQQLQKYILCVSVPAAASAEAHRLCEKIIDEGVKP